MGEIERHNETQSELESLKNFCEERERSMKDELDVKKHEKDTLEGLLSSKIKQIKEEIHEKDTIIEEYRILEESNNKLEEELRTRNLEKSSLELLLSMKIELINKHNVEKENLDHKLQEMNESLKYLSEKNMILHEQLKS